jgi:hypothetical protein
MLLPPCKLILTSLRDPIVLSGDHQLAHGRVRVVEVGDLHDALRLSSGPLLEFVDPRVDGGELLAQIGGDVLERAVQCVGETLVVVG